MTIRLSANLGFLWADRPLLDRVDAAAAAGFTAVEVHWPYDVPAADLRARIDRHGLILLGLNTPLGNLPGDFGIGAAPGREAECAAGFAQALAYARAAGAGAIHVMAGCVPKEERARGRLTLIDNLSRIAPDAAAAGVTILRPPRDGRMAFVRSPDQISVELLQDGPALAPAEPWSSMPNVGSW
jgi:hydroxypyruvate isomerase